MERREFLKKSALSTGAIVTGNMLNLQLTGCETQPKGPSTNAARLPRRRCGKTDAELSIIGFGGMMLREMDQDAVNRLVAESIERGVCYFDVAPTYGDAETKLGPPLQPYRKNVFLACKTTQRSKQGAAAELRKSLETLRTDYFDLYQLHAITDVTKDVDAAFAQDGAMEVFIEAKRSGQIRHLGFSAHSEEAALTALDRYDFDSAMFPVNFCCYFNSGFGPKVVSRAQSEDVAILAIKAMAPQTWTKADPSPSASLPWYESLTDRQKTDLGMRFALSQSVTAVLPPGNEPMFRLSLDLASNYRPLTDDETAKLQELAATLVPMFPRQA